MFTDLEADDDGVGKVAIFVSDGWREVSNFKSYIENINSFRQFQMFLRELHQNTLRLEQRQDR